MVDFNNETTVTQGRNEIVTVTRLEKRYNLFEAMEAYVKLQLQDQLSGDELGIVKARTLNLIWEMEGELSRSKDDKFKIDEVKKDLMNKDTDEKKVFEIIGKINLFLDDMGLTRVDVRKRYDKTRVEEENKEMGT